MPWKFLAKKNEIEEGRGKVVEVEGGITLALFNAGGAFYCLENVCPHRGGPLGEGELEGTTVTCPWHGWEFDVRTGQALNAPGRAKKFEIREEGEDIFVEL